MPQTNPIDILLREVDDWLEANPNAVDLPYELGKRYTSAYAADPFDETIRAHRTKYVRTCQARCSKGHHERVDPDERRARWLASGRNAGSKFTFPDGFSGDPSVWTG